MVNILMRMKWTVLRHSMGKDQSGTTLTGFLVGLILAGGTLYLSSLSYARPGVAGDTIATLLALWLCSWLLAPYLAFSFFYALFFYSLPVLVGVWGELPWMGAFAALAASFSTNLYGSDGTVLWITLVTPGAERADVRGKQGVWLLMVTPMAIILTIIAISISGQHWAWPWAFAFVASLLGGASGLMVLISVVNLIPRPDPLLRSNSNMLQSSGDFGQSIIMLVLVPLTALPAVAVLSVGAIFNSIVIQWAAVGVGILSGIFFHWFFGMLAYKRLEASGPELLHRMRSGSRSGFMSMGNDQKGLSGIPLAPRLIVSFCLTLCWIPLIPQGMIPMIFKLNGIPDKSWFLALYLEEAYQWPTILGMMALGVSLVRKHKQAGNDILKALLASKIKK